MRSKSFMLFQQSVLRPSATSNLQEIMCIHNETNTIHIVETRNCRWWCPPYYRWPTCLPRSSAWCCTSPGIQSAHGPCSGSGRSASQSASPAAGVDKPALTQRDSGSWAGGDINVAHGHGQGSTVWLRVTGMRTAVWQGNRGALTGSKLVHWDSSIWWRLLPWHWGLTF